MYDTYHVIFLFRQLHAEWAMQDAQATAARKARWRGLSLHNVVVEVHFATEAKLQIDLDEVYPCQLRLIVIPLTV